MVVKPPQQMWDRAGQFIVGESDLALKTYGEMMLPAVGTKIFARRILKQGEIRSEFLPPELCFDAAWFMLLDLYVARSEAKQVSVGSLCIAGNVPNTTGLRWISMLAGKDMVRRYPDPQDGRRILVELTEEASQLVETCLDRMADV